MKIIKGSDYEEMAAAFQCLQIQMLYQSLVSNGVESNRIRKICEDFTFSFGSALDQYWIESEAGKVCPTIAFTENQVTDGHENLYINNVMFSFSEYSLGNIAWFFDDNNPDDLPQKFGTVGIDE